LYVRELQSRWDMCMLFSKWLYRIKCKTVQQAHKVYSQIQYEDIKKKKAVWDAQKYIIVCDFWYLPSFYTYIQLLDSIYCNTYL